MFAQSSFLQQPLIQCRRRLGCPISENTVQQSWCQWSLSCKVRASVMLCHKGLPDSCHTNQLSLQSCRYFLLLYVFAYSLEHLHDYSCLPKYRHMYACGRACTTVPVRVEARGCCWVSSSITVNFIYWVRVSAWMQSSLIWIVYLASLLKKSLSLLPKYCDFRLVAMTASILDS